MSSPCRRSSCSSGPGSVRRAGLSGVSAPPVFGPSAASVWPLPECRCGWTCSSTSRRSPEGLAVVFVVVTFAATLALVLGAYWVFVARPDSAESAALRKRLKSDLAPAVIRKEFRILRPQEKLSGVDPLNTILEQAGRIVAPL